MDALVNYVVTSLVEHPDDVQVTKREGTDVTTYEVSVHADDTGKVIGRQGRVIKAIRTLVRAAASVDGSDATVEVVG
ncbi:MAG: KH domain-containing protein [Coriobacteriia bacterium]|nr:KH domain-containing protein [Coriobacteriia bacterium]